jgi:hypothetical protein
MSGVESNGSSPATANAYVFRKDKLYSRSFLIGFLLGGLLAMASFVVTGFTLADIWELVRAQPLRVGAILGLWLLGTGISWLKFRDDRPRLVIDGEGIKEYHASRAQQIIPWKSIERLDAEVTSAGGMVTSGWLNVYVLINDEIEPAKVRVSGLDSSPRRIIDAVKTAWVQFKYEQRSSEGAAQEVTRDYLGN